MRRKSKWQLRRLRCCEGKIKAAGAPGSSDSASRLSCTGKPGTKAGRVPPLAISGALSFSPRRDYGGKTRVINENMSFPRSWKTPGEPEWSERELNPLSCTLLSLAAHYSSYLPSLSHVHNQEGAVAQISRDYM